MQLVNDLCRSQLFEMKASALSFMNNQTGSSCTCSNILQQIDRVPVKKKQKKNRALQSLTVRRSAPGCRTVSARLHVRRSEAMSQPAGDTHNRSRNVFRAYLTRFYLRTTCQSHPEKEKWCSRAL